MKLHHHEVVKSCTLYIYIYIYIYIFFVALRPNAGHGLLILEVSRSHKTTHHSRYDSSGRVISSSQRPLPENTQHSQQTNIHGPGGIRTHDLSRRAATDLRLRPLGHWDRYIIYIYIYIYIYVCLCGLGSVAGIATDYGLDGPGIESRWGVRFSAPV